MSRFNKNGGREMPELNTKTILKIGRKLRVK